ncbi:RNA-directed RNA polymerase [ssRNA phage Gerhypos.4_7]|uniref:RNA-directed RNA polymerase n=2 Tax=Leviviricetes TaxID=2842243 RepID=A0A8S5L455_9VIRU|nr:RNA-directed RNA polymerase [ssRNA phage Gerhypos.4_7]QDH87566.1 MAG: RNA-dependent RNA polymerase [Leviviridae sp.]DAD52117.1 TPA_asm: RNA-directed RNA polymerase [ssRNA phage Gerhypos.4_7]
MKSPVVLLRSLFRDLNRLHPNAKGLDRDYHAIEDRVKHEGFSFLAKTLPILSDAIFHGIEAGRFTCPTNFKRIRKGSIPRLLSGLIGEVFDPISGILKEQVDPGVVSSLRQVCLLFKKTVATSLDDDQLSEDAYNSFFDCESMVSSSIDDDKLAFVIDRVSSFILPNLNRGLDELRFKHGPGAVSERYKGNQKWLALWESVKTGFLDTLGYSDLLLSERYVDHILPVGQDNPLFHNDGNDVSSCSSARLVAVPKNSTSKRSITVEPLMNQFVQQGLNTHLRDSILECSILSQSLALSDQSLNQKLAMEGSIHQNYSTLDLSSASDLLSLRLVERIFNKRQEFLDLLLDCRTKRVFTNKREALLVKFAGMGNATTFPIQSVVFAVVSIASILIDRGEFPTYGRVLRAARLVRCYGDDIIVASNHARSVVRGLETVGLKINTSKSFLNGKFKESCGADWYDGINVTPVYLRYHPHNLSKETRALTNYIEASNLCWERCFYDLSTALKEHVEDTYGCLPYVLKDSGVLGWRTRRGDYSFQKWDDRLHRWIVRSIDVRPRRRRDHLDGPPALLKFFLTPLLGRAKDGLEISPMRYNNKVSWRWVPV